MSEDEMRKRVNELRTARMSPQALGRMLRADAEKRESTPSAKAEKPAGTSDIYASLGL